MRADCGCGGMKYIGQFLLNFLNWLDHTGNFLLLGDPDETISARVARAKLAGVKWAIDFDEFLTMGQIVFTFGKDTEDHGKYALDPQIKPTCREILNLSVWPPRFHKKPVNEIMPEEIGQ